MPTAKLASMRKAWTSASLARAGFWNLHDVDEAVGEVAREAVAGEDELAADA
ncbi:MAG: hypothetical protein IPK80_00595 [Nannocystis sp.]|nr:hypothetical protein [Nannocystis sp.]